LKTQQEDSRPSKLLFVDDEERILKYVCRHLEARGYEVETSRNWAEAESYFKSAVSRPDIVFVEVTHEATDPTEGSLLRKICEAVEGTPVVVLSDRRDPQKIVESIQEGARDYICKPFKIADLQDHIHQILHTESEQFDHRKLKVSQPKVEFISKNQSMEQIRDVVVRIQDTKVPVLVHGESGVGKEVIARFIHQESLLATKPFIKVPCAAIPTELIESELFGFKKGAFTGAHIDRAGKFEIAHGGTIFLDEIGEMNAAVQAKFLHVLQEGRFSRLGSNDEIEVDVRIIAATNRNLEKAIADGSFREDLYYRLNVVNIEVAPLRHRRDEIEVFCEYFLKKFAVQYGRPETPLPEDVVSLFGSYHWPGNVRELENLIKRYVVLKDADSVRKELAARMEQEQQEAISETVEGYLQDSEENGWDLKEIRKQAVSVVEKSMIEKALRKTHWNKWKAAKELKVSYKTLLVKIDEYELRPAD